MKEQKFKFGVVYESREGNTPNYIKPIRGRYGTVVYIYGEKLENMSSWQEADAGYANLNAWMDRTRAEAIRLKINLRQLDR
tara:strand:- start:635 stop:877 length:243 start_codon:yes stop_codon:yes gene_type:complete